MDLTILNNYYEKVKNNTINYLPSLSVSLLIFLIFLTIAYYFKYLIIDNNQIGIVDHKNLIYRQLSELVYYFIFISGIIISIINLGVQTTTILTVLGTLGLAIGLALQNSLTIVASSIFIGTSNLYKIGDIIEVNGHLGRVEGFTLFNTILYDNESNVPIIIPNNQIQNSIIKNYTKNENSLLKLNFCISNNTLNNDKLTELIKNSLVNNNYIIDQKSIDVNFDNSGIRSGIHLIVTLPIISHNIFEAKKNINTIIVTLLTDNNIKLS